MALLRDRSITGLLIVDPYNDSSRKGGLRAEHEARTGFGTKHWAAGLLCTASQMAPRRLRWLKILGADPTAE